MARIAGVNIPNHQNSGSFNFGGCYLYGFSVPIAWVLVLKYNVPFYFGGTSLLIIVVVAMDFMAQVQSFVMQQQYGSLMKKANFKMGPTL